MTASSHRTLRRLAGLLLLLAICVPSQAGGGFKRAWKKFNEWLEKGQYEGIDTAYIQVPRLNRQIYLGGYAYWQSYRMDMPVHLEDVAEGYNFNGTYHQKAHSWQAEVDLGIDWKGLAVELPIPVRNKYSFSIGLAKNGSVWGARFRYKNLRRMDGTCTIESRNYYYYIPSIYALHIGDQPDDLAYTYEIVSFDENSLTLRNVKQKTLYKMTSVLYNANGNDYY